MNGLRFCFCPPRPLSPYLRTTLAGTAKERIADFVHGNDGFGNTAQPSPTGAAVANKSAAEFIVEKANEFPGEVTVVALASATNVTLALRQDSSLKTKLREVVHLGGAFFVNGNVNPATEANIFGDPEAADELYGSGANVTVIGLDVTQRLIMMKADLESMKAKDHPHTRFLYDISQFYMEFHKQTVGMDGIFMHDPAAMLLVFRKDLFTMTRGRVRVATEDGLCRGQTVMDQGKKQWSFENAWTAGDRPEIVVALDVDVPGVMRVFRDIYGMAQDNSAEAGAGANAAGTDVGSGGGGLGLMGVLEKGGRAFFELMGKGGGGGGGGMSGESAMAAAARGSGAGRFRNMLTGVALVGAGAVAGVLSVIADNNKKHSSKK